MLRRGVRAAQRLGLPGRVAVRGDALRFRALHVIRGRLCDRFPCRLGRYGRMLRRGIRSAQRLGLPGRVAVRGDALHFRALHFIRGGLCDRLPCRLGRYGRMLRWGGGHGYYG